MKTTPMKTSARLMCAALIAAFCVLPATLQAAWGPFKKKKPEMTLEQGVPIAVRGKEAKWVGVDGHIFHIEVDPENWATG